MDSANTSTILELLAGEDAPLLIGRDTFLVLDQLLDLSHGVVSLAFLLDGLASEGLNEDVQ